MADTTIAQVLGRQVWDSRGRPTVEAEVVLACGATGRAIAPAGASRGRFEAVDLRDGGAKLGGHGVATAVAHVRDEIAARLEGMDARDQAAVDGALITLDSTPDKSRLGGNALIAVSMAVLHAAAAAENSPLYQYLAETPPDRMPMPEIQIFGGGAHAGRRVDIQDFLIVCPGAATLGEALVMTAEVYGAAGAIMDEAGRRAGVADEGGYWPAFDSNEQALESLVAAIERAGYRPGDDVAIALDVAASEFYRDGRYRCALDGQSLDADGFAHLLIGWIDRYPIVSIEDPFAEDDTAAFQAFTAAVGHKVRIVGDDYLVTNAARIETAARDRACNAALIKPNQAGTVTETRQAVRAAADHGMGAVVSARSGESEDTTIVHLAVGWGADQLKVGSITRSERTAKWNEGLRIEEALARALGHAPEMAQIVWGTGAAAPA